MRRLPPKRIQLELLWWSSRLTISRSHPSFQWKTKRNFASLRNFTQELRLAQSQHSLRPPATPGKALKKWVLNLWRTHYPLLERKKRRKSPKLPSAISRPLNTFRLLPISRKWILPPEICSATNLPSNPALLCFLWRKRLKKDNASLNSSPRINSGRWEDPTSLHSQRRNFKALIVSHSRRQWNLHSHSPQEKTLHFPNPSSKPSQ